jgi:uncharacterized protein (DUF1778 family)
MTKDKTKDVRLELRMTSKDKAKLQAKANKEGKSVSDYIRAKTL